MNTRTLALAGLLAMLTGGCDLPFEYVEKSMFLVAHVTDRRGDAIANVSVTIPATDDQTLTNFRGETRGLRVTIGSARTHADFLWSDPVTHEWRHHNNVRIDIDPHTTTNHRYFVINNGYVSVRPPP